MFRGFRVDIHDNTYWSFRYEWVITAVNNNAKSICHRQHRGVYTFHDPTSMKSIRRSMENAQTSINEILSPLYINLHYR